MIKAPRAFAALGSRYEVPGEPSPNRSESERVRMRVMNERKLKSTSRGLMVGHMHVLMTTHVMRVTCRRDA